MGIKRGTKVIVDADLLCFSGDPDAVRYEHGNGAPREVPEEAFHLEREIQKAISYDGDTPVLDMGKASSWLKRALGRITLIGLPVYSHGLGGRGKPTGHRPRKSRWGRW